MAKGAIILLIAFLVLIGGTKYYGTYYSGNRDTNSTKPKLPSLFWGGDGGTIIVIPPPDNPELKLGVYFNDPSTSPADPVTREHPINWATLCPGTSKNSTVYARNECTMPFNMSLGTSNWIFTDCNGTSLSPDYQQYFTLTWDYDNSMILPNEVRKLTFTLTISPAIVENIASFSFNIDLHLVSP